MKIKKQKRNIIEKKYEQNKEAIKKRNIDRYHENKDAIKEYNKRKYEQNKETIKKYNREKYHENKQKYIDNYENI